MNHSNKLKAYKITSLDSKINMLLSSKVGGMREAREWVKSYITTVGNYNDEKAISDAINNVEIVSISEDQYDAMYHHGMHGGTTSAMINAVRKLVAFCENLLPGWFFGPR